MTEHTLAERRDQIGVPEIPCRCQLLFTWESRTNLKSAPYTPLVCDGSDLAIRAVSQFMLADLAEQGRGAVAADDLQLHIGLTRASPWKTRKSWASTLIGECQKPHIMLVDANANPDIGDRYCKRSLVPPVHRHRKVMQGPAFLKYRAIARKRIDPAIYDSQMPRGQGTVLALPIPLPMPLQMDGNARKTAADAQSKRYFTCPPAGPSTRYFRNIATVFEEPGHGIRGTQMRSFRNALTV